MLIIANSDYFAIIALLVLIAHDVKVKVNVLQGILAILALIALIISTYGYVALIALLARTITKYTRLTILASAHAKKR